MKNLVRIMKFIRSLRNFKEFERNCVHGTNFNVVHTSKCHSSNKDDIRVGNRCEIKGTLYSYQGGKIIIGNNFFMGFSSYIGAMDNISIGNDVMIASNVRIFDNNNHPIDPEMRRKMSNSDFYGELWTWKYAEHKPVIIEDNVWIGEYSRILKGVTIGQGSIVASNSVVTKSVPPLCIVAGNPAKIVKLIKSKTDDTEN